MDTPKTILVVDDDPQVLSLITKTLSGAGYHAVGADGAVRALEGIGTMRPDLMIVDMQLPGVNGTDLLQLLRDERTRFTPAIAITGDTEMDPDEVRASGFVALLHKPFTLQDLRRTVADCLG